MDIGDYKATGKIPYRHLLNLTEWRDETIYEVFRAAVKVRSALTHKRDLTSFLERKCLGLYYAVPDTKEELTLTRAMRLLGGDVVRIDARELEETGEAVPDTARALAGLEIDCLALGGVAQSDVVDFSKFGNYSVVNCSSEDYRPFRALTDFFAIYERFGKLKGLTLACYGSGNALCNALLLAAAKTGVNVRVCCPVDRAPLKDVLTYAGRRVNVTVTQDPRAAATGADILYASAVKKEEEALIAPFRVEDDFFDLANPGAVYMNPLPAHRNREATANVTDAPFSLIARQSAAGLPVAAALLILLSGKISNRHNAHSRRR